MDIQTTFLQRRDLEIPIKEDATMIFHVSGGKDSMSMARYCVKQYPLNPKVMIYNNTGFEHDGIVPYIQHHFPEIQLVELTSPGLFSVIRHWGYVPHFFCRFCTSSLKREPTTKTYEVVQGLLEEIKGQPS